MIKRIKSRIKKQSEFKKSVLTLLGGTIISQVIPILIVPILTRVYTPADFGLYTLIISIVAFGSVLATGRYEVAIMLPSKENEAKAIFYLSLLINFFFSSFLLIVIILNAERIGRIIGIENMTEWLYLVPFMIFITAAYQSVNYVINRDKKFKLIAINRVVKSGTLAFGQVFLGFLKNSGGLIIGNFISLITSIIFLSRGLEWKNRSITIQEIKKSAMRYIKFPKYALFADGINSMSNHMPVFFLLKFFSENAAGLYGLTVRILVLPITLISSAILDVYKQKASEDYIKYGNCKDIYIKTFKSLIKIALPSFIILFFTAPFLFKTVFGEEWREAGEYAQILSIMFFFRFIASPLSYTMYIAEKQHYDLIWQICLSVMIILSLYIGYKFESDKLAIWLFSLSYSFLYLIYLIMSYTLAKGKTNRIVNDRNY